MKALRILLLVVAVACIGVAASYPIRYQLALKSSSDELRDLSDMRRRVQEAQGIEGPDDVHPAGEPQLNNETGDAAALEDHAAALPVTGTEALPSADAAAQPDEATAQPDQATAQPGDTAVPSDDTTAQSGEAVSSPEDTMTQLDQAAAPSDDAAAQPNAAEAQSGEAASSPAPAEPPGPAEAPQGPTATPSDEDLILDIEIIVTPTPSPEPTPTPVPTPSPSPAPDRSARTGALAYPYLEKVTLDESKILPELREIYALNHDLVGWISIEGTQVDYPVVQTEDSEFYLKHDFYGKRNNNGQIILDTKCDPYTPSYNLIISGHRMNSGAMFGRLTRYRDRKYWDAHKIVEFDTLMARKRYVIFAVFNSADYDEDETGFRYNADIQYKIDADQWLAEIRENQLFDSGIDVGFGDEFITLTTCDRARRRNGRFVAVARRIREGESFE